GDGRQRQSVRRWQIHDGGWRECELRGEMGRQQLVLLGCRPKRHSLRTGNRALRRRVCRRKVHPRGQQRVGPVCSVQPLNPTPNPPPPTPTHTPTPTATPTATPTITPTPTNTPTPTPLGGCSAAPVAGCAQPQRASSISLNALARKLHWTWLSGATPTGLSAF